MHQPIQATWRRPAVAAPATSREAREIAQRPAGRPLAALAALLAGVMLLVFATAARASVVDELEPNDSIAQAQDIGSSFELSHDQDVTDSNTVPHATVRGWGGAWVGGSRPPGGHADPDAEPSHDYYRFTVPEGDPVRVILDIDRTNFYCVGMDSWIRLYDSGGARLAENNDSNLRPQADYGSATNRDGTSADSYLKTTLDPGTYYVGVGTAPDFSPIPASAPPGECYDQPLPLPYSLNVSVGDVPVGTGTITVNDKCSLQEAILNSNEDYYLRGGDELHHYEGGPCAPGRAGADRIVFDLSADNPCMSAGVCTITLGDSRLPSVEAGQDLTIDGENRIIVRGNHTASGNHTVGGVFYSEGTLTLSNMTVREGDTATNGGAISNAGGTLTLNNVTVADTAAGLGRGGGIYSSGTLTVNDSTISNNFADYGGGIYNAGNATVNDSTFSGFWQEADQQGGGIYNATGATLTVTNSTFSGNEASDEGGAIYNAGTLWVNNSTISGNYAFSLRPRGSGTGIANVGTATLRNTIVANSSSEDFFDGGSCLGPITDGGGNLDDGSSCGFSAASSKSNAKDGLDGSGFVEAGLKDNGGPTRTFALLPGSDAIDMGVGAVCEAEVGNLDQRGVRRPQDGDGDGEAVCDAGAFELDTTSPSVSIEQAAGQDDPTSAGPIHFTVVFSEPVTGFEAADVDLSESTTGPATAATVSGGPSSFDVAVSGMSGDGTVTASIPANAATDIAKHANSASTSDDNKVTFIAKAETATTIDSDDPDPSTVGQPVTVRYSVAPTAGGGTPSGEVTVSDGTHSCTATVAAGHCAVAFSSPGGKTLTASYAGDDKFAASRSSGAEHSVSAADTSTSIDAHDPDPSRVGQAVSVDYSVTVKQPGNGTPSGTVTVSDGVDHCSATVAAGSCDITLTSGGERTLTATYDGNGAFGASSSAGVAHTVDDTRPEVSINKASGQHDPTGSGPIHFTAVFSEPVSGLDAGDVTLGGTAGPSTAVVTEISPNDGTTYDIAVNGITGDGTVIASVPENAASDSAGNGNRVSTSQDNEVAYVTNTPPAAADDSYTTSDAVALKVAAPGVLGNDTDSDPGDTLAAELVSGPSHGSLTLAADGSFSYTPAANFAGSDSFTYKAKDRAGALSNIAKVSITVQDKTAPSIKTTTPAANATGVSRTTKVTAVFSEAVQAATLSSDTLQLFAGKSTKPIKATLSWNPSTNPTAVTISPASKLDAKTNYTVKIKGGLTGVKDLAGNPLDQDQNPTNGNQDKAWSFTTGS